MGVKVFGEDPEISFRSMQSSPSTGSHGSTRIYLFIAATSTLEHVFDPSEDRNRFDEQVWKMKERFHEEELDVTFAFIGNIDARIVHFLCHQNWFQQRGLITRHHLRLF